MAAPARRPWATICPPYSPPHGYCGPRAEEDVVALVLELHHRREVHAGSSSPWPEPSNSCRGTVAGVERISHVIAGHTTPGTSGRTAPVYDPATGQVAAEVDLASVEEVDAAVAVAVEAQRTLA